LDSGQEADPQRARLLEGEFVKTFALLIALLLSFAFGVFAGSSNVWNARSIDEACVETTRLVDRTDGWEKCAHVHHILTERPLSGTTALLMCTCPSPDLHEEALRREFEDDIMGVQE
jgi:hypothetical protein